MPEYRPPQRTVPARILSPGGWITATFHLSRLHSFLEFLNIDAPFFTLTDVSLPTALETLPFVGLRRSAARLIVPTCPEPQLMLGSQAGEFDVHQVHCMLESGFITGRLTLNKRLRVSDFLAHQTGFIMLRDCAIGEAHAPAAVAFLGATSVVGIGDLG